MVKVLLILTLVLLPYVVSQDEGSDLTELTARVNVLSETVKGLDRQVMLSQLYVDEQTRANGNSGIKQQRIRKSGTRPYYMESIAGEFYADAHDHPNFKRTVGIGEMIVVLNGVEFRTRHNDYGLVQPSKSSQDYHAVEEIPFPEVPKAVLDKDTVEDQIKEMKEWLRAWKEQNTTIRDYKPYFKPVMCYIEGAWTFSEDEVDEPYHSSRHKIEAPTWYALEEEVRYMAYSGSKHSAENNAFLPRVIHNYTADGKPRYAQWNYRILCHPLSFDLPLNRFRPIDDLKSRLPANMDMDTFHMSTRTRFQLNPEDTDTFPDSGAFNDLLDRIMREIPGVDNYEGDLQDDGYDGIGVDLDNKIINSAFYYRKFGLRKKGSSGAVRTIRERGFSDPTLYMAMTSNPKVVPMRDARCIKDKCVQDEQRWTYAIPLEIIYITPLMRWNPYKIEDKGDADSELGKTVCDEGQTGSFDKPYDGVNSVKYFLMPHKFYFGSKSSDGKSVKGAVYVKNKAGEKHPTTSSGVRVLTPSVPDVGRVRLRFPIGPVFEEGSVVFKELEALKDVVLQMQKYSKMLYEPLPTAAVPAGGSQVGATIKAAPLGDVILVTKHSAYNGIEQHDHTVSLTRRQVDRLKNMNIITQESSFNSAHTHKFKLKFKKTPDADDNCDTDSDVIVYEKCGDDTICWDNHPKCFNVKEGTI